VKYLHQERPSASVYPVSPVRLNWAVGQNVSRIQSVRQVSVVSIGAVKILARDFVVIKPNVPWPAICRSAIVQWDLPVILTALVVARSYLVRLIDRFFNVIKTVFVI
jgi:hypothetical protein